MKITVTIQQDNDDVFRSFSINPDTSEELHEAAQDVVSFIGESYIDMKEEGYE